MSETHNKLAKLLLESGHIDEAIEVLQTAVSTPEEKTAKRQGWDIETQSYVDPEKGQVVVFFHEVGRSLNVDKNLKVYQGNPTYNERDDTYIPTIKHLKAKDVKFDDTVFQTPNAAMRDVKEWVDEGERVRSDF